MDAYAAFPAASAATSVVFPAVVWMQSAGERTTVDVMNASPRTVPLAKKLSVTATFLPVSGTPVAKTFTLATRASITPESAGALTGGQFTGSVLLQAETPVAATSTVRRIGARVADGYAGVSMP